MVAGRLVEHVTGTTWDAALRERVVEPLGLPTTVTLPEEALLHRVALGHIEDADGRPVPAPVWMLPRSCGPAGLISSTVADQLAFAIAHLRGGECPDGSRLLSAASAAAMAAEQVARVDVTDNDDATSWGLGWARGSWLGTPVLGHDGNTIGQSAFLRLLPEHGIATVLLTNGGEAGPLHRALLGELLAELAGVTVPAPVAPPATVPDPTEAMVGTWAQASARLDVRREGDGLVLRHTDTTPFAHLNPEVTWERPLVPYADGVALVQQPQTTTWRPLTLETTAAGTGPAAPRLAGSHAGCEPGCDHADCGGSGVDVRHVAVPVADHGVARDRVVEPLQVVVGQRRPRPRRRSPRGTSRRLVPGIGDDVVALRQHPRQRELAGRAALLVGDRARPGRPARGSASRFSPWKRGKYAERRKSLRRRRRRRA